MARHPWFCNRRVRYHLYSGQRHGHIYILLHQDFENPIKSTSSKSGLLRFSNDVHHVATNGYQLLQWNLGSRYVSLKHILWIYIFLNTLITSEIIVLKFFFTGPLMCELYGMLGSLFGCASIWTMTMIALDRYNVIVKVFIFNIIIWVHKRPEHFLLHCRSLDSVVCNKICNILSKLRYTKILNSSNI